MKIIFLLIFHFPFILMEMNEIDQCVSQMQATLNDKEMVKTLSGLVGQGWNDLESDYTLPVLATRFRRCLTDPDGEYIIPDNVFVVPVRDAEVERTSTEYDSFKEFMSQSGTKVGVSGSATVKGVQIGGSFSSESQQTKENFEKKNSMMFLNKVEYYAYDLIANFDDFDDYFVYRLGQIAAAVEAKKPLWAQFLAEVFIGDFGTHVINKATAGAEIFQQTFIDRIEKFKGESSMQKTKSEVSIGFANVAKLSIGYESQSVKKEKHSSINSTTKSILKTRGGPDITRIGKSSINSSLLQIDNLIGLKKSGKFLYDVITSVPLPKYSAKIRYTVKHLIYNATQDFYRYNYMPGCVDMQSENYNYLANVDDGSCLDPNYLYAFGGIYQTCNTVSSTSGVISDDRCEGYERKNLLTGQFNCANASTPVKIKSLNLQFWDRSMKVEKQVCGFWSFIFGCTTVKVDEPVLEEIQIDSYWCQRNVSIPPKLQTAREANELDKILRHEVLTKLDGDPSLLKMYFPHEKDAWLELKETCNNISKASNDSTATFGGFSVDKSFLERNAAYDYKSNMENAYDGRNVPFSGLDIHVDQLDMLIYYPKLLKALLPILNIPPTVKFTRTLYDPLVGNPLILRQLLYYQKENIQSQEPPQISFFGGAFQGSNLNPFTGKPTCPPYFKEVSIMKDFNLCISNDNELKWPLRLGGFYHCESEEQICPKGYSSYLGYVHDNCDYYYCIRFATRQKISMPTLNRPPFID